MVKTESRAQDRRAQKEAGDPLVHRAFNSQEVWDSSETGESYGPLPRSMYIHTKFAQLFRLADAQKPIHGFQNNK